MVVLSKPKPKKVRRGGRNKYNLNSVKCSDLWSLYHININNLDSRETFLKAILSSNSFSVVTVNETHLQGKRQASLPGYFTYSRNRVDKNAGGIATAVIDRDAAYCVKVNEGMERNEFIVTRHSQFEVI